MDSASSICRDIKQTDIKQTDIIKRIKININATNVNNSHSNDGNTLLICASCAGRSDIVEYLLKNFKDVIKIDHQNSYGNTALICASSHNNTFYEVLDDTRYLDIVKLILNNIKSDTEKRTIVNMRNIQKNNAIDCAIGVGDDSIVEELEKYIENPIRDIPVQIVRQLHYASIMNNSNVINGDANHLPSIKSQFRILFWMMDMIDEEIKKSSKEHPITYVIFEEGVQNILFYDESVKIYNERYKSYDLQIEDHNNTAEYIKDLKDQLFIKDNILFENWNSSTYILPPYEICNYVMNNRRLLSDASKGNTTDIEQIYKDKILSRFVFALPIYRSQFVMWWVKQYNKPQIEKAHLNIIFKDEDRTVVNKAIENWGKEVRKIPIFNDIVAYNNDTDVAMILKDIYDPIKRKLLPNIELKLGFDKYDIVEKKRYYIF